MSFINTQTKLRSCPICGTTFSPPRQRLCCSLSCQNKFHNRKRYASRRAGGLCVSCGKQPVTDRANCDKCRTYHSKKVGPTGRRKAALKSRYDISLDQYETLLKQQKGRCAICRKPPHRQHLHVDHNHSTGETRGLLCQRCNFQVGWVENHYETVMPYIQRSK